MLIGESCQVPMFEDWSNRCFCLNSPFFLNVVWNFTCSNSNVLVKLNQLPSGNLLHRKLPIEFVDLPNLNLVIFQFANCKRLPEGNHLITNESLVIYLVYSIYLVYTIFSGTPSPSQTSESNPKRFQREVWFWAMRCV